MAAVDPESLCVWGNNPVNFIDPTGHEGVSVAVWGANQRLSQLKDKWAQLMAEGKTAEAQAVADEASAYRQELAGQGIIDGVLGADDAAWRYHEFSASDGTKITVALDANGTVFYEQQVGYQYWEQVNVYSEKQAVHGWAGKVVFGEKSGGVVNKLMGVSGPAGWVLKLTLMIAPLPPVPKVGETRTMIHRSTDGSNWENMTFLTQQGSQNQIRLVHPWKAYN